MSKGNVKKYIKNKGYESLDRNMLQDEDNLSIEAIGLLANLTSYTDSWVLYKTELYKRFKKSGRRKIESAWNELVEEKYIVQLRKRVGRSYEYIYYHSQERFTVEEITEIELKEKCGVWNGKVAKEKNVSQEPDNNKVNSTVQNVQSKQNDDSTVQNEQSKLNSTKRTDKKLTTDEVYYQEKDIDTLDTIDTEKTNVKKYNDGQFENEQKEKDKEYYMKKAFLENEERIPQNIATVINVFSKDTDEAKSYYNVLLLAKKNAEMDLDEVIWFENEPELTQKIVNTFSRCIMKIEKEQKVRKNPNGYIYQSIYTLLVEVIGQRQRDNHDYKIPNWLEEKNRLAD